MIGKRIKDLRTKKGMLQQDLAKELNVSKSTIAMWETSKRMPDTEMLRRIARFFNVSIDFLLDNEKSSSNNVEELPEELVILNRNAKNTTPENRKKLLEMAKIMFGEDWND